MDNKMNWYAFIDQEIGWLKEQKDIAQDPLMRDWFSVLVQMAERVKTNAHEEKCPCGRSDEHSHSEQNLNFFYGRISDPTLEMIVGYAIYDLDLFHLTTEFSYLSDLPKHLWHVPVVLSTAEKARQYRDASTHPLKNELKIIPWSFGHALTVVLDSALNVDNDVIKAFRRCALSSVTFRRAGIPLPPIDDDSAALRLFGMNPDLVAAWKAQRGARN